MQTKVSTKGQVVLPEPLRRKLRIEAGDAMEVRVEAGNIVLMPRQKRASKVKIVTDPITGLPVLNAGKSAPILTSKDVAEMLVEFP